MGRGSMNVLSVVPALLDLGEKGFLGNLIRGFIIG